MQSILPWCACLMSSAEACTDQVREVPLGEFTSKYGGDVNAMLMENINQRLQAAKVLTLAVVCSQLVMKPTQAIPLLLIFLPHSLHLPWTDIGCVETLLLRKVLTGAHCAQKAPSTAAQGAESGATHPAKTVRKTRNAVAAEGEQGVLEAGATACPFVIAKASHLPMCVASMG